MEQFLAKHADRITGALACFDRVNFKGHLPLNWPGAMERLMADSGVLIKDFTVKHSRRLVDHAKSFAEQAGRPYEHLHR